ncbi:MAG: C40 family peptidase [Ruminococcus sp.]|nr:C40 family peptidase [Ruminococcus sp.]
MIFTATNSDDNNRYGDQQDSPSGVGQNVRDFNNLKDAKNVANAGKSAAATAETGLNTANAATTAATTATGAEVAASAASGSAVGPVGTVAGTAWGLRHTLVKVLGAIGVIFLVLLCFFYSLPEIVFNSVFGFDGGNNENNLTIESNYMELSDSIQGVIDDAYAEAVAKAEKMIKNGKYDYDISLLNLTDNAKASANYDVANILSIYSVMIGEGETVSKADMVRKLEAHKSEFFPISSEVKKEVTVVPTEYWTYRMQIIPVVTNKRVTGTINGVTQYQYTWEHRMVYVEDKKITAEETITVDRYRQVTVETGTVFLNNMVNVHDYTCYIQDGTTTISPTETEVEYLAVTIGSFNSSVLQTAFGYDPNAIYGDTGKTNAEIVKMKTDGLKSLLYGNHTAGESVPLTDAELIAMLNNLNCNETRKALVQNGLSLVGKVPYFWGGKSSAGWNEQWGQPKLVTASGSSTTGTIQPYGMDCTGFTDWVYKTTLGISLYEPEKYNQIKNCHPITESELKSGDIGFLLNSDGSVNHALLFVGYDADGKRLWVHCTAAYNGVVVNTPHYDYKLQLYRPNNVVFGDE